MSLLYALSGHFYGLVAYRSRFIFSLETNPTTEEGFYSVTVCVNPSASTQFTLEAEDEVRPQEGSGKVFDVPDGIAYHVFIYLPLIVK
jgi:hypothetical protein